MVARLPERSARRTPRPRGAHNWGLAFVCLLLGLAGCQTVAGNELLEVSGMEPRQVHFGSPWNLVGDGFALGSRPLVTLTGTVFRAGHAPQPLSLAVRAATQSQERLRVVLPSSAQMMACGSPGEASHATFRGEVQVAIASHATGAAPVTGTLRGAELELYPTSQTRSAERKAAQQGQQVMAFVGFELTADVQGGLRVIALRPQGRAAQSGLLVGDRIVSAAGVTVLQPSDLGSEPARSLPLGIYRGHVRRTVLLNIDGLAPHPPSGLSWAAIPIGAVSLLLFLSVVLPTSFLGWFDPVHAMRQRHLKTTLSRPYRSSKRLLTFLPWLASAVLLVCEVLGRSVGPFEHAALLLPAVMGVSAVMVGAVALAQEGRVSARRWSLVQGARAAFLRSLCVAPALVVLVRFLVETGVDFERLMSVQGARPWEWRALSGPAELLLCCLLLLPSVSLGVSPEQLELEPEMPRAHAGSAVLSDWYLCSSAALACLVFLGGGKWGVSSAGMSGLSVAIVLVKYGLLVVALRGLRTFVMGLSLRKWWLLGTAVAIVLSALAITISLVVADVPEHNQLLDWIEGGFGPCCAAAIGLGLAGLAVHWLRQRRAPLLAGELSPWL